MVSLAGALADPALGGRLAGSPGEARAAEILRGAIERAGLVALGPARPLPVEVPVLDAPPLLELCDPEGGVLRRFAYGKDFREFVEGPAGAGALLAPLALPSPAGPVRGVALLPAAEARGADPRGLGRSWPAVAALRDRGAAAVILVEDRVEERAVFLEAAAAGPTLPVFKVTSAAAAAIAREAGRGAHLRLELRLRREARISAGNLLARPATLAPGERPLLLAAHYDHVGCWPAGGPPCPGAQDNAAGVAVAVEVARALSAAGRPLLLALLAAEEVCLGGSRALVAAPPRPLADLAAVLVLDGLGNPDGGPLILAHAGGIPAVAIDAATAAGGPLEALRPALARWGRGDHLPFIEAGLDAVATLSDGLPGPYHTAHDRAEGVSGAALRRAAAAALALALALPRERAVR